MFKAAGFKIERGRHWTDSLPDGTRKAREIDVIAYDYPDEEFHGPIIRLVIECKHGKTPWVVLAGDAWHEGSVLDWVMLERNAHETLAQGLKRALPTFHLQAPTAFGVIDMGKSGARDDAYEAMTQAMRAAWQLATSKNIDIGMTFPVVVTDGPLVRLQYDTEGNEVIEPTRYERVRWSGAVLDGITVAGDDPALIDVVQYDALPEYVERSRDSTQALREIMLRGANELAGTATTDLWDESLRKVREAKPSNYTDESWEYLITLLLERSRRQALRALWERIYPPRVDLAEGPGEELTWGNAVLLSKLEKEIEALSYGPPGDPPR
jgi:hypothetical protein